MGRLLRIAGILALATLPACGFLKPPAERTAEPATAPGAAVSPTPRTDAVGVPSGEESLRAFYASVESQLVAKGRLRRDVAPADAPYTTDDLVRDFENIALYVEYTDVDSRYVHEREAARLRRWDEPVRVAVMTGGSDSPEDAARDRANVAAFASRLSGLTGVDMKVGDGPDVNFLVLFMTSEERETFADQIGTRFPNFAPSVVSQLRQTPLDIFCATYSFPKKDDPSVYAAAIVVIRAEHPPFTRLSCVNEEMAQAMGLPNDSDLARPSLFNDSLEFALLTQHDAVLLRMLYDPRLKPGMTADEVRPLLPAIARDAQAAQIAEEGGAMQVAAN